MLHELLLALFGIPGGLFLETDTRFIVNPKLEGTLLSPAEVELLNRIVILGSLARRFRLSSAGMEASVRSWHCKLHTRVSFNPMRVVP